MNTVEEYGLLIAVAEKGQIELLWKTLTSYPKNHWLVKSIFKKALLHNIPKEKTEQKSRKVEGQVLKYKFLLILQFSIRGDI